MEENLTPAAYLNSTRNEKGFKARGLVGVCYNPSPLEGDIAPRDLSSALALLTEVLQKRQNGKAGDYDYGTGNVTHLCSPGVGFSVKNTEKNAFVRKFKY